MSLTAVSCFYTIPNKHGNKFYKWFRTTLRINCNYVIFTTPNMIPILNKFRNGYPTQYVIQSPIEFKAYSLMGRMITHPEHCPTKELCVLWNEKIAMMEYASKTDIFKSNWFLWIDAGICTFRYHMPPTNPLMNVKILEKLPKNKLIFTSSLEYDPTQIRRDNYYHYISGTYLIHKTFIPIISTKYYEYMNKLMSPTNIWTDQVILTHIFKDFPELFYKVGTGYGRLLWFLYGYSVINNIPITVPTIATTNELRPKYNHVINSR